MTQLIAHRISGPGAERARIRPPRIAILANSPIDEEPWWLKYVRPGFEPHVVNVDERQVLRGLVSALARYRRLSRYDVVVTQQDGLCTFLFAALRRLGLGRGFRHVVNEFITTERHEDPRSRLKYAFLRASLGSVDGFVCSCRGEIDYYVRTIGLAPDRFRFVPLATTPRYLGEAAETERGLVVSAGRTGRDYATLVRAVAGVDLRLVIVAGSEDAVPGPPAANVQVL